MLNEAQQQTLAVGIRAETNQTCADALAIRDDVTLEKWVNSASTQDAWNPSMTSSLLFEATDVAELDGVRVYQQGSHIIITRKDLYP